MALRWTTTCSLAPLVFWLVIWAYSIACGTLVCVQQGNICCCSIADQIQGMAEPEKSSLADFVETQKVHLTACWTNNQC